MAVEEGDHFPVREATSDESRLDQAHILHIPMEFHQTTEHSVEINV